VCGLHALVSTVDRAFKRLPHHVGVIPDGNRRWAVARGGAKRDGYAAGIEPGLRLLEVCRELGIEEVSVYGFTKENVHRPPDQVAAFRDACVEMCRRMVENGMALQIIGDCDSEVFPQALRPYADTRAAGGVRVNLLINYGWQWDVSALPARLCSGAVSRVDLVVRWGGRCRLSGFLPIQCAYADLHVVDTLWPDMREEEFLAALRWYERQDVTLGG
jgi:undecaprenyl diphosphate synthase